MKDQLPRFLLPTADMKKAIDRNSKQDKDLSHLLKQLEKEKKMALEQLTKKQDAFKKQVIKKQASLSQKFKLQFFELENVSDRDRSRPDELNRWIGLRRASSCVETRGSSISKLPAVISKTYSLPVSPLLHDRSELKRATLISRQAEK